MELADGADEEDIVLATAPPMTKSIRLCAMPQQCTSLAPRKFRYQGVFRRGVTTPISMATT
jgi:hypothetical protein